jgi:hypothetical protein
MQKQYDDIFNRVCEVGTYKSNNGTAYDSYSIDRIVFSNFREGELGAGTIEEDKVKILIRWSEINRHSITPKRGDKILVQDQIYSVENVDSTTRRVNGVLMAYEFVARY